MDSYLESPPVTATSRRSGKSVVLQSRVKNLLTINQTFWDKTGGQWATGKYWGKYAGVFVSTAGQGGGQESTAMNAISTLVHHGIIYVPLGYKHTFAILSDLSEVRGGSPWGAGTFAGGDGSRMASAKEIELATTQGEVFYKTVASVNFS